MAPQVNLKMRFAIAKLLEEHTVLDGKYVVFKDGWSDERIAEVIGCRPGNVVGTRKAVLGGLKPSQNSSYTGNQYTRVSETLAEHERLLVELDNRVSKINSHIHHIKLAMESLKDHVKAVQQDTQKQSDRVSRRDTQQLLASAYNSGESPKSADWKPPKKPSWVPDE